MEKAEQQSKKIRYIDIYAPDLYGKSEEGITRFF